MKLHTKKEEIKDHSTDALILGLFEADKLNEEIKSIDKNLNNEIQKSIDNSEFTAEYGQMNLISSHGKLPAKKILVVGLGKKSEFTTEKLRRLSAKSAKALRDKGLKSFTTTLNTLNISNSTTAVVDGIILGLYDFKPYKTVDIDKIKTVDDITLLNADANDVNRAVIIASNVNYVRDLVNGPAQKVTPIYLAKEAEKIAKDQKIKLTIFNKKDIEKLKMGGILGVTAGSSQEPRFIILDYNHTKKDPICFVGKGITFDSGGLDVKPAQYMENMKCDMAGAATVLSTIKTLSELQIDRRVVGIIPTCENLIGPSSFKQGDILTAYNGKTMEIWHTDAEGRLILADALSYADKNYKPIALIDIATLTGASAIALGGEIVSMMSTDEKLKKKYLESANSVDEMTWELPLYEDYADLVKGDIGDVRNTAKEGMGPGTITAGFFLSNFVGDSPWLHLDIGASGWTDSDKDYKKKGGTGVCLRSMVHLINNWEK